MDKLGCYRQIVEQVIREYASHKPSNGKIESEAVIDREGDHYEVLNVGWDRAERVHDTIIHGDIVDGKIWIQCNNTDRLLADEFVEAGVPKEDIVLAFHPAELAAHGIRCAVADSFVCGVILLKPADFGLAKWGISRSECRLSRLRQGYSPSRP